MYFTVSSIKSSSVLFGSRSYNQIIFWLDDYGELDDKYIIYETEDDYGEGEWYFKAMWKYNEEKDDWVDMQIFKKTIVVK